MSSDMPGRINEAILEIANDLREGAVSYETADKITMRILSDKALAKPEPLKPEKMCVLREDARTDALSELVAISQELGLE